MAKKTKEEPEFPADLELVWIRPGEAQENPLQWRLHPELQIDALDDLIHGEDGVGWAGAALLNDRHVEDGWSEEEAIPTLLDGHARDKVSSRRGEPYPALKGRWTPAKEKLILATLDPIAGLAMSDINVLAVLLEELEETTGPVDVVLTDLAASAGIFDDFKPPSLDELVEIYGEPEEEDNWPYIRVQVSPEDLQVYLQLVDAIAPGSPITGMKQILSSAAPQLPNACPYASLPRLLPLLEFEAYGKANARH